MTDMLNKLPKPEKADTMVFEYKSAHYRLLLAIENREMPEGIFMIVQKHFNTLWQLLTNPVKASIDNVFEKLPLGPGTTQAPGEEEDDDEDLFDRNFEEDIKKDEDKLIKENEEPNPATDHTFQTDLAKKAVELAKAGKNTAEIAASLNYSRKFIIHILADYATPAEKEEIGLYQYTHKDGKSHFRLGKKQPKGKQEPVPLQNLRKNLQEQSARVRALYKEGKSSEDIAGQLKEEGLTPAEIAAEMACSVGSIYNYLSKYRHNTGNNTKEAGTGTAPSSPNTPEKPSLAVNEPQQSPAQIQLKQPVTEDLQKLISVKLPDRNTPGRKAINPLF